MIVDYKTAKDFYITPLELLYTPFYPGVTNEQKEYLIKKGYYKTYGTVDLVLKNIYMKVLNEITGFSILISSIIDEHYWLTKGHDKNINYLWHLYKIFTKAGEYKPFILVAELQLLNYLGYLTEDEVNNICLMIQSEDIGDLNLVYHTINTLRKIRIDEQGEYNKTPVSSKLGKVLEVYTSYILNTKTLTKYNKF